MVGDGVAVTVAEEAGEEEVEVNETRKKTVLNRPRKNVTSVE